MLNQIQKILHNHWLDWFDQPPPKEIDLVKIAGNPLRESRLVFIAFVNRGNSPVIIVKIPRNLNQKSTLQNEFDILRKIHSNSRGRQDIPKPLWFGEVYGVSYYIETAIVGKLMGNMRGPWLSGTHYEISNRIEKDFSRATQWLANFHKETTSKFITPSVNEIKKQIETSFEYEDTISARDLANLDSISSRIASSLANSSIPLVCEHGDFWAGNIYIKNDGLGIIDWSDAHFDKLPLYDISFFISSYILGFGLGNHKPEEKLYEIFTEISPLNQIFRRSLDQYSSQLNINKIDYRFWIGYALLRKKLQMQSRTQHNNIYAELLESWLKIVD